MQGKFGSNSQLQQASVVGGGVGKSPASEFVLSTYNPRVAIFSTPAASEIASKNNLTVPQLIAPFTRVQTDVSWHEPLTGHLIVPKGLRFTPVDLSAKKRLDIDSQLNKKFLQDMVGNYPPTWVETEESKFRPTAATKKSGKGSAVGYNVEAPQNLPWFSAWREQFLKLHAETQSSQYDFLHHCMACIMVMSSSDGVTTDGLTETVAKLSKTQQQHQTTWSTCWAFPSVLKFYLILHEQSNCDQERADAMYQSLRTTYGGNFSFMVQLSGVMNNGSANETNDNSNIWHPYVEVEQFTNMNEDSFDRGNSQDPTSADVVVNSDLIHPLSPMEPVKDATINLFSQNGKIIPLPNNSAKSIIPSATRGQHLSSEDISNLQTSVNEFVAKALLPYIDRQSRLLHESIVNRRGMSKSFFSATKRLFGGSAKSPSSIVYTNESLEMMSRKLADIYFLFGHYAGSYQLYHQLKKDFLGDSAWVYYASSLEMAAVSHFMMSQVEPPLAMARAFPVHYVTDAITYYIDNCRMTDSAMKCALICCECLKQMENYSEAAAIYIRMTSEDCDLKSALMLEQAAHSFLNVNYIRKYALHCVLAGHRYSKSGLKMHSLKCYLQADQVYTRRGWRYAEDHVHFTISRHQNSLQLNTDVSKYLQLLLITPSPQPVSQISLFYREYIATMAKIGGTEPLEFFVPKMMCSSICVRTAVSNLAVGEIQSSNVSDNDSDTTTEWDAMEEQLIKESGHGSVVHFRPSRTVYHQLTDNTGHPAVPCHETFYVEIPTTNPLNIPISMRNVKLVCNGAGAAESNVIQQLDLMPSECKLVRFGLRGTNVGSVSFDGIHYELESSEVSVHFKQKITLQGPRLNSTKKERCGHFHAKDLRNRINVVEQMPLLEAVIESMPPTLYHCQTADFQLVLSDKSPDHGQTNRITEFAVAMDKMKDHLEIHDTSSSLQIISTKDNYCRFTTSFDSSVCRIPCLLKSPSSGDSVMIKLLVLYNFKSLDSTRVNHRVIKISVKIPLLNCLKLEYSTLKLLNASSFVGLVRSHNLTPDGQIVIQKLEYLNKNFEIQEVNSVPVSSPANEQNQNHIQLTPMESRNIILKTSNKQLDHDFDNAALQIHWELTTPGGSQQYHKINGRSKLLISDLPRILSQPENSFIFEFNHGNRCENDFNLNPCFTYGIELLVHARISGNFTFKVETNSSQASIGPGVKASGDDVFFVGQTSWALNVLPLNTYTLKYTVALMQPGVFNIAPTITVSKHPTAGGSDDDLPLTGRKFVLHSPLIVAYPTQQ